MADDDCQIHWIFPSINRKYMEQCNLLSSKIHVDLILNPLEGIRWPALLLHLWRPEDDVSFWASDTSQEFTMINHDQPPYVKVVHCTCPLLTNKKKEELVFGVYQIFVFRRFFIKSSWHRWNVRFLRRNVFFVWHIVLGNVDLIISHGELWECFWVWFF